jgi:hypothetical protein
MNSLFVTALTTIEIPNDKPNIVTLLPSRRSDSLMTSEFNHGIYISWDIAIKDDT